MRKNTYRITALSIITMLASYGLIFTGNSAFAMWLSGCAIILGTIGFVLAASMRLGPGFFSALSATLGFCAFVLAALERINVLSS